MIQVGGRSYELLYEHKNAWNAEAFRNRYSEVLERYDYIIGDWGYNQLRLKGFFKDGHPKASKDASYSSIVDYINEYCNFGCAYFMLQKLPSPKKLPGEGDKDRPVGSDLLDEREDKQENNEAVIAQFDSGTQGVQEPAEAAASGTESEQPSNRGDHGRERSEERAAREEERDSRLPAAQAVDSAEQSPSADVRETGVLEEADRDNAQQGASENGAARKAKTSQSGRAGGDSAQGAVAKRYDRSAASVAATDKGNDRAVLDSGYIESGREPAPRSKDRTNDTVREAAKGGSREAIPSVPARAREASQPSAKQGDRQASSHSRSGDREPRVSGPEGRDRGRRAPAAARENSGEARVGSGARELEAGPARAPFPGKEQQVKEANREAAQAKESQRAPQTGRGVAEAKASKDSSGREHARGSIRDKQRPAGFSKGRDREQARDGHRDRDRDRGEARHKAKDMKEQPSAAPRETVKTGDTPQ